MKPFLAFAIILAVFAPAVAFQTDADFTGKWEGTFNLQRPDGTKSESKPIVFNLTQQGGKIIGTAGPAAQQWTIDKGAVKAGKATFEMQQPKGPKFKFTLAIVKGRLQGEMASQADGIGRGKAVVDAVRAK